MAKVKIVNLTKRYGKHLAVSNLNLEVADGEVLVLLGPSGCGKTTTIRCIAGLEKPDEGEIFIGETLVNDIRAKDRDIAMVFQSYALYPHMTVFDNIAFPLRMRNVSSTEMEKKVKETAETVGIAHLLQRKPGQLSGGERQRTALARAIVREPHVFLMDEPLSNLDAKLRLYMRAELKNLQRNLGITTVYVTHDQVEALTLGDRVAVMNEGSLQQIDTPSVVYDKPANLFVAGFMGSPAMNFLDGTLTRRNKTAFLDLGKFQIRIPDELGKVIESKSETPDIVLGVRPEDIVLESQDSQSSIEAEVFVVEPMGSEILISLKIGENVFKWRVPPGLLLKYGQKVRISFNISRLHVFDKKTKTAIL